MRFGMSMVVLGAATAGALLAGCSLASSGAPASSPASGTGATNGQAGSESEPASAASSPAPSLATSPASTEKCQPGKLSLAFGAKSGTSQVVLAVDLTNEGTAACTMQGFPGVDLVGSTSSQQSYRWSLARQSVSYSKVTLQPGQAAHFNLTYLPAAMGGGGNLTVAKIVITPPDDFTRAEVTWNESVLLQDGATHPGTYIGPVMAGA
jgi:hypothetical protein